jgi:hypothetical protein
MSLGRHFKSLLRRREYEQDASHNKRRNEVIESVESSCVRTTTKKLNLFRKAKDIQFERSRAPSPKLIIVKYSLEISPGDKLAGINPP